MAEKIFTVPLRKGWLKVPKYRRGKKAIGVLKSFLLKNLKKDVKIGKHLNSEVWMRGNRKPPARVKVRIEEEKDSVVAELINAPREIKEEKKKGKFEKLKEKVVGKKKEDIKNVSEELGKELKKEEQKNPIKEAPKESKEIREKLVPKKEDIKK